MMMALGVMCDYALYFQPPVFLAMTSSYPTFVSLQTQLPRNTTVKHSPRSGDYMSEMEGIMSVLFD